MVIINSVEIQRKIDDLTHIIIKEHLKGKIPLFVIGAGISTDLKIPDKLKDKVGKLSVPIMSATVKKLYSFYGSSDKSKIPNQDKRDIERRFEIWLQQLEKDRKVDRSNVGRILWYFQEKEYLKAAWIKFNEWLLHECVNEKQKIGIMNAPFAIAHEKIAELYEKVNVFCLTTNFDGLLYRALQSRYEKKQTNSYYTGTDAERLFTDETIQISNYAEIQIRGDILFVRCDPIWCKEYNRCGDRSTNYVRVWEPKQDTLKCKKSEYMKPFISFPGTYEKDKEVREIIEILWKYLAHKISCIITIGLGGLWDPILVAFLSDLARERSIPFVDVNISPERSYIAKEIVNPDSSLKMSANEFMITFSKSIESTMVEVRKPSRKITYQRNDIGEDHFWARILTKWEISEFEEALMDHPLVKITKQFAQLGLKSKWWGISTDIRWLHNRLNHSKGVMKIATFLYEKACEKSGRPQRDEEKQFLRIAALLHDIGHLPFSHLIEEVFQELNWKPGGHIDEFSHDYYTGEKIKKIFEDKQLKDALDDIGYSVKDLIRLINGEFGIGFLDAIINAPIDADKIDYVFRDAESTKVFPHFIDPKKFLEEIGENISINSSGLLVLKGISAEAAFTVLKQRERLYNEFYLSSAIRLLEKAVRFIITAYFVHTYNISPSEISENIKRKFLDNETQLSDLGAIRIAMASAELEDLSQSPDIGDDIEAGIIQHMKGILETKSVNKRIKRAVRECFSLIEDVDQETKCRDEKSTRIQKFPFSEFPREQIEKIRYDSKTVILRVPGAILIDVLPPFEFFKIAGARKRKSRSDGTNIQSECMLSSDLIGMVKEYQDKKREQGKIRIYRIGDESEVKRALDLFERLLEEEKILEEVE
jgi:HD superfamily phosphohydrolase/NAD-dependent SIR2 family protein deacetylase